MVCLGQQYALGLIGPGRTCPADVIGSFDHDSRALLELLEGVHHVHDELGRVALPVKEVQTDEMVSAESRGPDVFDHDHLAGTDPSAA
jgi:hypothetical protein